MVQYIIARAVEDEEEAPDGRAFFAEAIQLVDSSYEAESGVRAMMAGAVSLRTIARDLAPASKTMERALNRVLSGIATIQEWEAPLRELLGDEVDTSA